MTTTRSFTFPIDRQTFIGLSILALTLTCAAGCDTEPSSASRDEPVAERPAVDFRVGPSSDGVLYTWVDEDGSFRLTEDADAIPEPARAVVRVVVDGEPVGSPEYVYVANLEDVKDDRYAVASMPRKEWEALGRAAREQRVAELQPEAPPDAQEQLAAAGVDAIIYGADWCQPCHLAEDYLRSKGVSVVKKDIEEDPLAAREMQEVLKGAGLSGSSIPVLNVGGTVLRGFSQKAIDAALTRSRRPSP